MKNAKRDITLNEKDSIEDMAQTERTLFMPLRGRCSGRKGTKRGR